MAQVRDHEALLALLEARARRPFSWRSNHCAGFAAAAVKAQTGYNPMAGLRCRSLKEARDLIASLGGLEAAVDARLNRIPLAQAARGDLAAVPDEAFGIRLMVVEGATLVGPAVDGHGRLPRSAMTIAWSADPRERA